LSYLLFEEEVESFIEVGTFNTDCDCESKSCNSRPLPFLRPLFFWAGSLSSISYWIYCWVGISRT